MCRLTMIHVADLWPLAPLMRGSQTALVRLVSSPVPRQAQENLDDDEWPKEDLPEGANDMQRPTLAPVVGN